MTKTSWIKSMLFIDARLERRRYVATSFGAGISGIACAVALISIAIVAATDDMKIQEYFYVYQY